MKPVFTGEDLKAETKDSRDVENVSIDTADNGFSVRVRYEQKPSKDSKSDMSCCPYEDPETLVFSDTASLLDYLNGLFA